LFNGKWCRLNGVRRSLARGRHFQQAGEQGGVSSRDREATLFIAETEVMLDRPAKTKINGRSTVVAGVALRLRSILVQVRNDVGRVLAEWMLISRMLRVGEGQATEIK
jgi:hypothetical protein